MWWSAIELKATQTAKCATDDIRNDICHWLCIITATVVKVFDAVINRIFQSE